jgi:hypothetical protein
MKRFLGLVCLLLLINACDDGDLTVETIDFADITAVKCTSKDVIYKVKDSEILYLEIPSTSFGLDETPDGTPTSIAISSSIRAVYRQYNATASADNVCPSVPSATPNVLEQWITTSGTIQITTTAIKTTDATNNSTKITGYKHYIVLKNVTFQKPSGDQLYETYVFGNYTTNISSLPFGFDEEAVTKSSCNDRVFSFSGGESLVLDVDNFATLFANEATVTPRTATISATKKLTYKLFNGTINDIFFCTSPTPSTPTLAQEWNAIDGVEGVDGIIEVTSTSNGPNTFRHTVRLKKVTLKKGNSDFYLGDDFLYGSFDTTF